MKKKFRIHLRDIFPGFKNRSDKYWIYINYTYQTGKVTVTGMKLDSTINILPMLNLFKMDITKVVKKTIQDFHNSK